MRRSLEFSRHYDRFRTVSAILSSRFEIVSLNVFPRTSIDTKAGGNEEKMALKNAVEYPNIPWTLALIGGALIVLVDIILLTVSVVILPHLNYTNFQNPRGYTGSPGALAAGFVGAIAAFGLICGAIVTLSALMLRLRPNQRQTWGILVLVFSILSFFGAGGFIVGAVLGIVGAVLSLTWKPPATPTIDPH